MPEEIGSARVVDDLATAAKIKAYRVGLEQTDADVLEERDPNIPSRFCMASILSALKRSLINDCEEHEVTILYGLLLQTLI